jgi:uncharacterized iron-regulated protein
MARRRGISNGWRCAVGVGALGLAATVHPAAEVQKVCLAPASWVALDASTPRQMPANELIGAMARRDVVLLGERHDAADDHRWQLHTLAALHGLRPNMVIGFESFPRRVQPVLDRWVAGELTERQFLEQSEWDKVWSFPPGLYLPLFQFARIHRIPMVALNVERDLTQAISKDGWDRVPAAKKEGVSRPAPASQAYRDALFEIYKVHRKEAAGTADSGEGKRDDPEFLRFVESQTTWDRAMAEALARRARPGSEVLVVGIMGTGHVEHGYGVRHQLLDLGVTNVGTLIPVDANGDCADIKPGLADAVFALPQAPREPLAQPPRPRLGVRLQQAKDGVLVVEVTPGSLAESTGLRAGDLIVSLAGSKDARLAAVIAAVRAQPAGTWMPLQIQREGKSLDFVVKFPAKQ